MKKLFLMLAIVAALASCSQVYDDTDLQTQMKASAAQVSAADTTSTTPVVCPNGNPDCTNGNGNCTNNHDQHNGNHNSGHGQHGSHNSDKGHHGSKH